MRRYPRPRKAFSLLLGFGVCLNTVLNGKKKHYVMACDRMDTANGTKERVSDKIS